MLQDARLNATLSWLLVVFLLAIGGANLATGNLLWAGFASALAVLAVIPPARFRSPRAMLPWEVLALAALPLLARVIAELAAFRGDVASYLSVAALALVVAVELHLLTTVQMTYRFAVAFVVIATMGTAGAWAVVRYAFDVLIGTTFILPAVRTEAAMALAERRLMVEFVASSLAGVAAGVVFELYFRRRTRANVEELVPEEGLQ